MPENKGKHLTKENREVIEDGIRNGDSARAIAKRIDVSPSTITREVKSNRTLKERKARRGTNLSVRCVNRDGCGACGTACEECLNKLTYCKDCRLHSCITTCPDYERKTCPTTKSWPFVCPVGCSKRAHCGYPKCSYNATEADEKYRKRLSESRAGIAITEEELSAMDAIISPLVKQGHSFSSIFASHGDELPVGERCAYNYQAQGLFSVSNIELPRIVRYKPRKADKTPKRNRIDRTGRTYADFLQLPFEEQVRAVQGDSVEGFENNKHDILSLHIVSATFQFYLYKKHADSSAVVEWFDIIERALGSPEAFAAIFQNTVVDRGVEFDDWAGMERSCLVEGAKRCNIYYCDPMKSNQKSNAERNHQQLRRLLPKGRSDFDKLNNYDVAVCCSHVNSYVLAERGGKCAFELVSGIVPQKLFDELGLERIAPDDVVLKPYLMAHAVVQ